MSHLGYGRRADSWSVNDAAARDLMTAVTLPDGLVAVVKRDCPTCTLIAPVLAELDKRASAITVYTQDDPAFPEGVTNVVDDTALETSYRLDIETVPTLIRVEGGEEAARTEGWKRSNWEE